MGNGSHGRSIFRQRAIQAYQRGFEKDIVPRLVSWPLVACMWALLGVFLAAGIFTWYAHVPVYASATGIFLPYKNGEGLALVFFQPEQAAQVRPGLPALVQIGESGPYLQSSLEMVEPGIQSPEEIRKKYSLDSAEALRVTQPSVLGIVRLGPGISEAEYAGSLLSVKVQTGSRSLLAALASTL